jgi:hypothetical protein
MYFSGFVDVVVLGVQCGQLTARLREGIDDLGRSPAHAGVEQGEQAGWPSAENSDISNVVTHLLKFTPAHPESTG